MKCRHCDALLADTFINLFNQPPSNSFLTSLQLDEPEIYYPLVAFVCPQCFLVQIPEYKKSQEIFSDEYVYHSSYSTSWVEHAHCYADMVEKRFGLNKSSLVVEIASNDGYLLQWFTKKRIPCLGIEPAGGTADVSKERGIETICEFFGKRLASQLRLEGRQADLLIGNNVLAHVPDINDFVSGLKVALKPHGIVSMEFPHIMNLVEFNQFDTIYHEHFFYFSLLTVQRIFSHHGLTIFDVEEIPTHGGSLRIFARHAESDCAVLPSVSSLLGKEYSNGLSSLNYYNDFQRKADLVKMNVLAFLIEQKRKGKTFAAYGAAAKGNTLLNYCGIRSDLISFCVDKSPHKQGLFMPGSHIPVLHPDALKEKKPDYIILLPWNIKNEVIEQHNYVKEWGGRFITFIPELEID